MKRLRAYEAVALYTVLIFGALLMTVPFFWMILTAFKSVSESTQLHPFAVFPSVWRTDAFVSVIRKMNFIRLYWNTLVLIAGRILCTLVTATLAGYALGRLHFPGKNVAFALVLFQMMIPPQIFIIPQYLIVNKLGMLNTAFALLFPGLVSAFGTFLMRQAFIALPQDVEQAARIDGCNTGQIFLRIMLPLVQSSLVALGIFTALFAYKELMWPLVVNTDQNTIPLSAALAKLQGQFVTNYPELMAASCLACVPMILIYLMFQKQFISGIAFSGSKL
ncbi:carbohydrate ABC transporter permease [Treponema brennaborense]|uniref:ABC-type transporter, integral membrane subunit n=1 Tax=Treponema brennaborense (strain DSM 12168 / CIP 105900 / DD5/3) TaxID=906968 RepID=F4LKP2_TREBD|nr:carbohydrate ABC transporter permease [Treponema brennaborense]AEE15503.1 ABC-type transporter, integral membrane subunit [Treponema brennaborense DSM 12168]